VASGPVRIDTLVLRRDLWSESVTAAPAASASAVAHGDADEALGELRVYCAEVLSGARPAAIARHLLPPGTELVSVSVPLARAALPPRLREPQPIAFWCIVVPERTRAATDADGAIAAPRGRWVFVPALDYTFHLGRGEDVDERARAEIARVVDAGELDDEAWKRLLPPAAAELVPMALSLANPTDAAASRKDQVEAERRRRARETLDEVGHVLAERARAVPLVGRDRERDQLRALLGGRERLSVLLVGEPGAGKTALVEAWALEAGRPAWATSVAQLVAGASGLGEWQERVAEVLAAAEILDAALYLDDFGALFADRPEQGGVDVGSALRRWITAGRVRVVGELADDALDGAERRDVALIGSMTRLRVEPLAPAAAIDACRVRVRHWARTEPARPRVAEEALPRVIELARRYLPYRSFPGKAIRFLDELRAAREGERDPTGAPRVLGADDVYEAFGVATGIPPFLLRDDRALLVEQVIAAFRRRMIGQDEAVRRVAETLCVVKAQLQPADKPLATFLFVGPTGVGKTELARSLAAFLFGAADRLIRFDMSEYADPWAAERLIRGSAAGDGLLTARIREQPFGVVLLDEIEKAHPAVFDLLLQVLGEGRLTDARGRTAYFHNAIIILTSNLGARGGRAALGLAPADPDRDRRAELDRYAAAVASAFRPELVNRLDKVVAFHRLSAAEVAEVATLALSRLGDRRGLGQAGISVDASPAAIARLAAGGTSADHGVRALRRHLHDALVAPAARLLAQAGATARGGVLVVRIPDELEAIELPVGARLGLATEAGVAVALYRRGATSSKRAVRGAMAVSQARRDSDRDLLHPLAVSARDQIGWLRGQLATADRPRRGKQKKEALSAVQRIAMQTELARLAEASERVEAMRAEIRAAEELALTALASDGDADELAATAIELRRELRRRWFWLVTARQAQRKHVTLAAHGPDHAAGLERWITAMLDAVAARSWRAEVHLRQTADALPSWPASRSWGPPRSPSWLRDRLGRQAGHLRSVLLRVDGDGAAPLLGLEAGLHRFWGASTQVDPCHVLVEPIAPRTTFDDEEWEAAALAAAWPTAATRGPAEREYPAGGKSLWLLGKAVEVEVAWRDHAARLDEIAADHLQTALADDPDRDLDDLYDWKLVKAAEGDA